MTTKPLQDKAATKISYIKLMFVFVCFNLIPLCFLAQIKNTELLQRYNVQLRNEQKSGNKKPTSDTGSTAADASEAAKSGGGDQSGKPPQNGVFRCTVRRRR